MTKKIAILGGGVIGVVTAYFLKEKGFDVTVLESAPSVASGTSFANGAQLSYSKTYPLSNLKTLSRLPSYLLSKNTPIHLKKFDLEFLSWGTKFVAECFNARQNGKKVLDIALRSREIMHALVQRHEIDFDYTRTGKMFLFKNKADFNEAARSADGYNKIGISQKVLNAKQAVELEPALAGVKDIAGVIYSEIDECGDAQKFTAGMAKIAADAGVKFIYGFDAANFKTSGRKLLAVNGAEFDAFVICLGIGTNAALKPLGIKLPIYPMKGYSITVPSTAYAPKISITDESRRIVYSTLGSHLRVAGVAEFNGYNMQIDEKIIASVISGAKTDFPQSANYEKPEKWCGLRPMTPSTVPIIEQSRKFDNLYFNTGHGMLGWTLAAGSAQKLANLLV